MRLPLTKLLLILTVLTLGIQAPASVDKYCGTVRQDLKYTSSETSSDSPSSQVELCLESDTGGVHCGISSDPLLLSSLNLITALKGSSVCMKFDSSQSPAKIVSAQGSN